MRLVVGPWLAAPIDSAGETLFVVGDIHGCTGLLETLLDGIGQARAEVTNPCRLVFLGDMNDRGPDSIGSLRRWAQPEPVPGIPHVERLMGNHEQLMLLAAGDGPEAEAVRALWLKADGSATLAALRAAAGQPKAAPSEALLLAALGETVMIRLAGMRSHLRLGNLLLVHAGLQGGVDQEAFLAQPWQTLAGRPLHWAWITSGFLDWAEGFGGTLVVHGHSPPARHARMTGQADPHLLYQDRLCLDGGSAVTGIVAGAQLEPGRYRILRAIADPAP